MLNPIAILQYFSVVTATTVGYGDVSPQTCHQPPVWPHSTSSPPLSLNALLVLVNLSPNVLFSSTFFSSDTTKMSPVSKTHRCFLCCCTCSATAFAGTRIGRVEALCLPVCVVCYRGYINRPWKSGRGVIGAPREAGNGSSKWRRKCEARGFHSPMCALVVPCHSEHCPKPPRRLGTNLSTETKFCSQSLI